MSKKDRIAALEALLATAERERDAARYEARTWQAQYERAVGEKPPSLVDQARGELERRWGWLLDLAGFGS